MKPLLLHYYLTNRCNARCTFCSIWTEHPKIDASAADVVRNLKAARHEGCRFVDFTGGEPLLHPELPRFLSEAHACGYITSITTNCILFPSRAAEIAGHVDLIHFSIDADSAELHNRIRGSDSFTKVLESIDIALSHGMAPDLLFTYTNENIDSIEGVYEIARRRKLILILDPVFDLRGPDRIGVQVHRKALELSKKTGVYLNKAHLALRAAGGNHVRKPLCKAVTSTLVILPDNTLALPCFHHRTASIPLNDGTGGAFDGSARKEAATRQGAFSFCEGCHINCYFDPSYQYIKNKYFLLSLASKWSYAWTKHVLYGRKIPDPRNALLGLLR